MNRYEYFSIEFTSTSKYKYTRFYMILFETPTHDYEYYKVNMKCGESDEQT